MILLRPLVYLVAAALIAWTYAQPAHQYGAALDRTLWFGLFATVSLYLALLPGPLYAVLPDAIGKRAWLHARRALGITSAIFAGLHGYYGFFGWVGGFEGARWWSWDYNAALAVGTVAWLVLVALALTSFDRAVAAMGRLWKRLHRLVYLAGILVIAHAATVTIHVLELQPLLVAWFAAILGLLFLELVRFRQHASRRADVVGVSTFVVLTGALYWSTFLIGHHRH